MGTRHIIAAVIDGEYKLAQYGQWDGYPSGQGADILQFLQSDGIYLEQFKNKLRQCTFLTEDEIKAAWIQAGASPDADWVGMDVSDKFKELYPQLSRDQGAKVLELIANSFEGLALKNSLDFARDSLMCEYAYVIDFDKNTFEIYVGFNKQSLSKSERFAHLEPVEAYDGTKYYPVRHIRTYSLTELPDDVTFLSDLEPEEE